MTSEARGTVVIAGGGQAGFQTAASLRDAGYQGRVALVGDVQHLPYQRPPLSKAFLDGGLGLRHLTFRPQEYFDRHAIDVVRGPVTGLDRERRLAVLERGQQVGYDHLVLATGCRARRLRMPGDDLRGVHYLRDVDDAQHLADRLATAERVVVVGAGFVGLEVAAAARKRGVDVTVLDPAPHAMGRAVTRATADLFVHRHRSAGTRVELGTGVQAFLGDGSGQFSGVETSDGEVLPADLVVVGVGVVPNTELAEGAGLPVDDGVLVDEHLRSLADPHISAVGDCSRFLDLASGARVRLESVQNAVDQARCVAARLTGSPAPYEELPWFWTDQLGLKLQIAGLTTGHDLTETVGDPDTGRFSVYCFAAGRLLGVESVNRPADHLAARRLLARGAQRHAPITPELVRTPGFSLRDVEPA